MKKKIIENVEIEKVWFGWVWIWQMEDWKKIIVSGWVLPWMVVDIRILKNKNDYIKAQSVKVKSFWNKISDKICDHHMIYDKNNCYNIWCWWCKWQILSYKEQIKLKDQVVRDSFFGSIFFENVYDWILECKKIFNYRNKMEFSFWKYFLKDEQISSWSLWFHKQWMFSKIVDVKDCLIASQNINEVFSYIKWILEKSWLDVYDQKKHTGFLRHLLIREWINTWDILVNLDVAPKYFNRHPEKLKLWKKLNEKFLADQFLNSKLKCFIITENDWLADVMSWKNVKFYNLWWDWYINEKLIIEWIETNFRVSSFSFFQTNTIQAQTLFETAKSMLPEINWNILDLYCWTWTIWLSFLNSWIGNKLFWVDIVEDAIKDANYNANLNWLENQTEFIADKAENLQFNFDNIELIVVDPPRSWLHKDLINFLWETKKKNKKFILLYISCNPVTMNRDLQMLIEMWFEIQNLKAVDMFSHTHHVEMVWILS